MVASVDPFVVTDLLCRRCPTMGKSGTENLRRQLGYGWTHGVPGRRRLSGDTNLGYHDDFRGPGFQRCNRLGTNVIPGTTRYLLGGVRADRNWCAVLCTMTSTRSRADRTIEL